MEVKGQFNAKRFYEVLAGILSDKYGVTVTAKSDHFAEVSKMAEADAKPIKEKTAWG